MTNRKKNRNGRSYQQLPLDVKGKLSKKISNHFNKTKI